MKSIHFYLAAMCVAALLTACGGSKSAVAPKGNITLTEPCTGPEFRTNKEYFRASAMGLSDEKSMADRIAQANAREKLATAINSKLSAVMDNYNSQYRTGENAESKGRFEALSRTVVSQQLEGLRIICEELQQRPDGKYEKYVAVELSGNEDFEAMGNRIKNDDKLRIDFEYEKFKKVFNEEMSKVSAE
ncbi:MAG: LPP20 family lipoprotein [Mediterranea sp.]|jgi:membrane-bound lytic murein transglycosylase|nr:LPP20 family lipoprotein [Mediterranea sp.]